MQATYPIYLLEGAQKVFEQLRDEFDDFAEVWECVESILKKTPDRCGATNIGQGRWLKVFRINMSNDERRLSLAFKYNDACVHIIAIRFLPDG